MLSTAEVCKHLGISTRYFRMLRALHGPIDGALLDDHGSWCFPAVSLEAWRTKLGDEAREESEESPSIKDALAELAREVSRMASEVFKTAQQSNKASADVVEQCGKQMLSENKRMGDSLDESFKLQIEVFKTLKELYIGQGQLEAEVTKAQADQTVRLERTKVAGKGMRLFAPIVKAGLAKALGAPMLAKDARAETVLELVRSLQAEPGRVGALAEILDDDQRESMLKLVEYAEGREKLEDALGKLKTLRPEQRTKIAAMLTQRELIALASLEDDGDEDEDEDEEEKKPEPEKKSA